MKPTMPNAPRFEDLERFPKEALQGLLELGRKVEAGQVYIPELPAPAKAWAALVQAKPYALDRVYVELVLRGEA